MRGIRSDDINRNIKKGSAKYEQYDGCERRNMARMAKMSFCRWARERERPREGKLRKGEHSFRQLKFQIFATELHLYHLSTRVTQFVAVLFLQLYHIAL